MPCGWQYAATSVFGGKPRRLVGLKRNYYLPFFLPLLSQVIAAARAGYAAGGERRARVRGLLERLLELS